MRMNWLALTILILSTAGALAVAIRICLAGQHEIEGSSLYRYSVMLPAEKVAFQVVLDWPSDAARKFYYIATAVFILSVIFLMQSAVDVSKSRGIVIRVDQSSYGLEEILGRFSAFSIVPLNASAESYGDIVLEAHYTGKAWVLHLSLLNRIEGMNSRLELSGMFQSFKELDSTLDEGKVLELIPNDVSEACQWILRELRGCPDDFEVRVEEMGEIEG